MKTIKSEPVEHPIPRATGKWLEYLLGDKVQLFGAWCFATEAKDTIFDGAEYTAYVRFMGVKAEDEHMLHSLRYTYSKTGTSAKDAIDKLTDLIENAYYREIFAKVHKTIPWELSRTIDRLAETWLKVNHTVLLGSGDPEDVAMGVLRQEYYESVKSEAEEILEEVRDGRLDEEGARNRVREGEVIYMSEAHKVILISRNDGEYFDPMGEDAPPWETVASYAKQADVMEMVEGKLEDILEARKEEEEEEEEEEENDRRDVVAAEAEAELASDEP